MKLVYSDYQLELELKENQTTVLVVENPKAYTTLLSDLWNQSQGKIGRFILSDREKVKSIAKEVCCIFNPFTLDCNDKKIVNRLYQELKEQADTYLIEKQMEVNQRAVDFLEEAARLVPYAIEYNLELDAISLFKLYGVKLETCCESLMESIVEYLKVLSQICHIKVVTFVGLRQYLSEEELKQLYEFVFYEKISLILVETGYKKILKEEKCWILDSDLCIIELERLTPFS